MIAGSPIFGNVEVFPAIRHGRRRPQRQDQASEGVPVLNLTSRYVRCILVTRVPALSVSSSRRLRVQK